MTTASGPGEGSTARTGLDAAPPRLPGQMGLKVLAAFAATGTAGALGLLPPRDAAGTWSIFNTLVAVACAGALVVTVLPLIFERWRTPAGRRRYVTGLGNAGLAAASALVAALVAEAGLRVAGPLPLRAAFAQIRFQRAYHRPHPVYGKTHVPGAGAVYEGPEFATPVRFNSLGFRGPEIPPVAPRTARIMVLGDSYTEALQVADGAWWQTLVKARLERAFPAITVHMMNFGVSSSSPGFQLPLIDKLIRKAQPHVVLVNFCANDVQGDAILRSLAGTPAVKLTDGGLIAAIQGEAFRPRWLYWNSLLYYFMAETVKPALAGAGRGPGAAHGGGGAAALGPPGYTEADWAFTLKHLDAVYRRARRSAAVVVFAFAPSEGMSPASLADVRQRLTAFAAPRRSVFVDPSPVFAERSEAGERLWFASDSHWNETGNEVYAEALLPALGRHVAQLLGLPPDAAGEPDGLDAGVGASDADAQKQ